MSVADRIARLNREATKRKTAKDLVGAIACLREAKALAGQTDISFPVETWLRLPLFLQAAGETREAICEFDALAAETRTRVCLATPQASPSAWESLEHAELASIYYKAALACKRAKLPVEEAKYARLSETHRAQHEVLKEQVRSEMAARYAARQEERARRRPRG